MGNEEPSDINLNFYSLEEFISLQLPGNTPIKELINKYANDKSIAQHKKGKLFSLIYEGIKLNLNSNEPISNRFKDNSTIFVVYKNENITIEKILQYHNNNKIEKKDNNTDINNKESSIINNIQLKEDKFLYIQDYILKMMAHQSFKQKEKFEKNRQLLKILTFNDCMKHKNKHYKILAILKEYLSKIGITSIVDERGYLLNEEEELYNRILLQFICNGCILKKVYELSFKLNGKKIIQLENDENEKVKFHNNLEKHISLAYNLKKEEKIIMTSYKKDKNDFKVIIFNTEKDLNKSELLNIFMKDEELKNLNNIEKKSMIEFIRLTVLMLDDLGDNFNDKYWGKSIERGGEIYYPPIGWHKYGLRVANCYDEGNNEWLGGNKSKEWCIAYSGFSGLVKNNVQIYENDDDLKHPGRKVGIGIYCSPFPKILEDNSNIFNIQGTNYKIGFMIKVKPDGIRCPKTNKNIWVIDGNDDTFRPYGILIKKI